MAIHKSPSFTRAVEANSDIIVLRRDTITGFNPTNLPDEAFIHFSGRDTVGDGGGGLFRFDRDSTATADGGIVFAPTGGGRLLRDGWTANGFTKELSVAFLGPMVMVLRIVQELFLQLILPVQLVELLRYLLELIFTHLFLIQNLCIGRLKASHLAGEFGNYPAWCVKGMAQGR